MESATRDLPRFLYGTAWKEDSTQELVELALEQGFRGIDTANQRRHYFEEGVGAGIRAVVERGLLGAGELFLQTKFTFRGGQDHRLPYDPDAPIARQVEQSFASSLDHLGVESIDSYVLHGPSQRPGLGAADWEAWGAMEAIQTSGGARLLGVSNVTLEQLDALCQGAEVVPAFVQNRCFAHSGWDAQVRAYCERHGIVYQGFSLLTANVHVLRGAVCRAIAERHGVSPAQVVFRLALHLGMLPLTGTTRAEHMRADLAVLDFSLDETEIEELRAG